MNDIQRIAQHYGLFHQLKKLQEELDELWDQAENARCDINVTKDHILPKTLDALVDELADVSVMLQQIMHLTNTHDAVRERIQFKVNRQLERIAVEANNEQPDN